MGMGVYHQLLVTTRLILLHSYKLSYWLYKKGNNWFVHDATFHINISISKNHLHYFPSPATTQHRVTTEYIMVLVRYHYIQGHAFFPKTFHAFIIKRTLKAQTQFQFRPNLFPHLLDTYIYSCYLCYFSLSTLFSWACWLEWALGNAQLKFNHILA
jgi:hypothetical protein